MFVHRAAAGTFGPDQKRVGPRQCREYVLQSDHGVQRQQDDDASDEPNEYRARVPEIYVHRVSPTTGYGLKPPETSARDGGGQSQGRCRPKWDRKGNSLSITE